MNSYPSDYDVEIGEIGRRNGANSVDPKGREGSTPSSLQSLNGITNSMGITVSKLKRHIKDWPERDDCGNETTVWVETGNNLSGPCNSMEVLNYRVGAYGTKSSDILFRPSDSAWKSR